MLDRWQTICLKLVCLSESERDMSVYVCYDLRGIQSFIFRVPKLKHIIGGSAIIDMFDREIAPELGKVVFCGGGRGGFECSGAQDAERLRAGLTVRAHELGLDIRFGIHADYSEASHSADRLCPFVPSGDELDGQPCSLSGLYPVGPASKAGEHPLVRRRASNEFQRHFERRLLDDPPLDLGPGLIGVESVQFLRSVGEEDNQARAGLAALDGRRWAVVCMDGNDMGRQFRAHAKSSGGSTPSAWNKSASEALDACSRAAARAGIERVVHEWDSGRTNARREQCTIVDDDGGSQRLVLPIRPLVVGGDDIVMLCHPAFAFAFIEAACTAWDREAAAQAKSYNGPGLLWPATNNRITISAGVLFAPVTLPLHVAVPYAESLLASAKKAGRPKSESSTEPSEPSIDWECVTESMLDTPAARRQREARFKDGDIDCIVELTQKPYLMRSFRSLRNGDAEYEGSRILRTLPRSLRHEVLAQLRRPHDDRELFRLRIGKRHPKIAALLDEDLPSSSWRKRTGGGESGRNERSTWIADAIEIIEELPQRVAEDA
jgi:hypothetical protein